MTFLRNQWYAAAWADEVQTQPIGRKILGEDIALYRTASGKAAAIGSVCPHRFAPLEYGVVVGENLKCKYHGLQFGPDGECNVIPAGVRSPNMRTTGYPVAERDSMIFVWIGDDDRVVDPPGTLDVGDAFGATVRGYLHVDAHYQLITDNLMDDAHATHLHTAFETEGHLLAPKPDVRAEGDKVFADTFIPDTSLIPAFSAFYDKPGKVDQWLSFMWDVPSSITITAGVMPPGHPREEGISTASVHMITPETETSSHYFWTFARNCKQQDDELSETMRATLARVFHTEDKWMLEGQQRMMRDTGFWDGKPILLPQDKAAIAIRRHLDSLVAAQERS
jgi:phenylpropionate dioxygenase-like ring-hydroxylating dioxygenase large terminal subunit